MYQMIESYQKGNSCLKRNNGLFVYDLLVVEFVLLLIAKCIINNSVCQTELYLIIIICIFIIVRILFKMLLRMNLSTSVKPDKCI